MLHGIQDILDDAPGVSVVGAALDPTACLAAPDDDGPVLYVVDQAPADVYNPQLIQGLIATDPGRRIVVYSVYDRMSVVAGAYASGASAFVNKCSPLEELLKALQVVAGHVGARDRYYPDDLATALANYYSSHGGAAGSPRRLLSKRKLQIYLRLAEGYSHQEVAAHFDLNPRTVINQVALIRRKLGIPRDHFRSYAIEHGLVDPLRAPRAFDLPSDPPDHT